MSKTAGKFVLVVLESLSGSGHKIIKKRPKLADKLEAVMFDPIVQQNVLFKEMKKLKTLRRGK